MLESIRALPIPEADKAMILGGNAAKLLSLGRS
jgi:predicted TIM-barrel fold metal-dependent hydrolase